MNDEILSLRTSLLSGITVERLKTISSDIISAFRSGDYAKLGGYASLAGLDTKEGVSRVFSLLMHQYHPDKHAKILKEIDLLSGKSDTKALRALSMTYLFSRLPATPRNNHLEAEEETCYAADDFGYGEAWAFGEDSTDDECRSEDPDENGEASEDSRELNFTEAVNLHFYGNLDEAVTLSDLKNLDGDLDLSDSGITSLRGAENCSLLSSLNLSGNRIRSLSALSRCVLLEVLHLSDNGIETVTPLADLSALRELDISFNRIEDISALLCLERLEYVNIIGNPISDRSPAAELVRRGVIVIE